MFLTISMIIIIASLLQSAWKAFTTPGKTVYRAISVAITALVLIVIGNSLPWNDGLHFFWWYGLVAACAVYAGAVAWRAMTSKPANTI
ncbi:hypothetical protein [Corynebacterium sp. HMSC062A03]|uniref:hypothetical protein n=1 Tax=Corynebacterium sp. HMSC062A03 TaxID=1739285 RepID=UPI0008A21C8B|nr:hypothetical protein [Corynebacterium sp. HMSC062A03]OFL20609.1 hypothetical protein HMPREF2781_04840 [Corynebacterium sp. HMSC062A03]